MKVIYTFAIAIMILSGPVKLSAQHTNVQQNRSENQVQHNQPAPGNRHHESKVSKRELVQRIKNLEKTYSEHLDYWDKQEMQNEIDEILDLVNALIPDERIFAVKPMNEAEFLLLKRNVSEAPFADTKKQIIVTSAVNNYFVIDQLVELANIFPFDDAKLEIIEAVYPKTLDRENNYLLYNCLAFSSSKEKLDKIIQDIEMKSRYR